MHDVLRRRLLRKIESLPEERIYQVLDYVEFLEARYGEGGIGEEVTGLQRFAERLEDGLRRRTVSPGTLREAFQLISVADRVLSGVASAGRELLGEPGREDGRGSASLDEVGGPDRADDDPGRGRGREPPGAE